MKERDWSKELAKIDKKMASMSDEELAPREISRASEPRTGGGAAPAKPPKAGTKAGTKATTPAKPGAAKQEPPARKARPETVAFGVFARLTLSVILGLAILVWPYEARCGFGLAAYLGAVAVVAISGGWSAVWTWRHRAARAHILSLLILLWGLVLGSLEVLPRVGYAKPDMRHPATWVCR